MKLPFQDLDRQETLLGELVLRRRSYAALDNLEVYEVQLDGVYLMSSLFHEGEVALTQKGLDQLSGEEWDIVVGGLGLGYTAAAALGYSQLKRMIVVEALGPVIDWHRRGLVPNGRRISSDERCRYYQADFFRLASGDGFDPETADHEFDAILLDIDHSPEFVLNEIHRSFYSRAGMARLKSFLKPDGVFGLWSNDPPDEAFLKILSDVFSSAQGHLIDFHNPLQNKTFTNGVYVARCSG